MPESADKSSMHESDHDVDENVGDGPIEQLHERGWLPKIEHREEYRPGGFHPVHIGDRFGTAGRFRVIHKLGRGGLATVWLCLEQKT
jgi:serine/threonine-protein kinase SRPK3